MAINLRRNTKMFISTVKTGFDTTNTYEVPVLDGYSFSQDVETQTIELSEASCSPIRGQKIFNTALNPVAIDFPTYAKPYRYDGTTTDVVERVLWEAFVGNANGVGGITDGGDNATRGTTMDVTFVNSDIHELLKINIVFVMDTTAYMIEDVGVGSVEIDFSIDAISTLNWSGEGAKITELEEALNWVTDVDYLPEGAISGGGFTTPQFIKNKLSQIEVYVDTKMDIIGYQTADYRKVLVGSTVPTNIVDGTYSFNIAVDGGAAEQIDVVLLALDDIDGIIVKLNAALQLATGNDATASLVTGNINVVSDNDLVGAASTTSVDMDEDAIADAAALFSNIDPSNYQGFITAQDGLDTGKQYFIPITGGSLTLENNVTYLTPEELGKVNVPIAGGFTGTRSFSGTLNAYLNTGSNKSGGLLADLTTDTALKESTNRFWIKISVGGCASSPIMELTLPQAHLVIPTTSVEDVISTEIGFTALGSDITQADEISISYTADLT